MGRLDALANRCRKRGGDCPCVRACEAIKAAEDTITQTKLEIAGLQHDVRSLEDLVRRLNTPPATLARDIAAECPAGYVPQVVFDGNEAFFGYYNEDTTPDWIEASWPFEQDYIWPDDCERFGITVEVA